jgi:hypothetical protein
MGRLRTPFFFIFLVAFGLVVLLETGSGLLLGLAPAFDVAAQAGVDVPPGRSENPGGLAISYLALIDVIAFGTAVLMGAGLFFKRSGRSSSSWPRWCCCSSPSPS